MVGGDVKPAAGSDDDEDDDDEEGAKVFSNDWLPPKQPPKEAAGCVTPLYSHSYLNLCKHWTLAEAPKMVVYLIRFRILQQMIVLD